MDTVEEGRPLSRPASLHVGGSPRGTSDTDHGVPTARHSDASSLLNSPRTSLVASMLAQFRNSLRGSAALALAPPPSPRAGSVLLHRQHSFNPEAGLDLTQEHTHTHLQHLNDTCTITIVDYSKDAIRVTEQANDSFAEFLTWPRPASSKVRWICVQGLAYDVIKPLATTFHLHPLAVEDIVHHPQRVKVDFYDNHMYISMILLTLDDAPSAACNSSEQSGGRSLRTLVPTLRARMMDPARSNKCKGGGPAPWGLYPASKLSCNGTCAALLIAVHNVRTAGLALGLGWHYAEATR